VSRMTKEELREDPVLEWIQNFVEKVQDNSRWIVIAVVAVVVVIAGTIMIGNSRREAAAVAGSQLIAGQAQFLQGNYAGAENQIQQLLATTSGGEVALRARLVLGDALLAQARPSEALTVFEDATRGGGDADLQAAAQRGYAVALESVGRFGEALTAFEQAAAIPTSLTSDDLLGGARCAMSTSDPAKAIALLEQIELGGKSGTNESKVAFYLAQAEAALGNR
jgi:tetratricopeptide (TPR) repeat protein